MGRKYNFQNFTLMKFFFAHVGNKNLNLPHELYLADWCSNSSEDL
jgi:hypothetical protein